MASKGKATGSGKKNRSGTGVTAGGLLGDEAEENWGPRRSAPIGKSGNLLPGRKKGGGTQAVKKTIAGKEP